MSRKTTDLDLALDGAASIHRQFYDPATGAYRVIHACGCEGRTAAAPNGAIDPELARHAGHRNELCDACRTRAPTYRCGDRIVLTEAMLAPHRRAARPKWAVAGMGGVCYAHRLGRQDGHLCIRWDNAQTTNTVWIHPAAAQFVEPQFRTLDLQACPEELLSEEDLVVRTLVCSHGLAPQAALDAVALVRHAMQAHGIVFYRP